MPTITEVSATSKAAFKRPYKTRSQRREIARRKHDENADHKFLIRATMVVGALLLIAMGCVLLSKSGTNAEVPATVQALQ